MSKQKTIAFFPEAAFGPALNSVGIAQACEEIGHQAVFITDPGMAGVYLGYGFREYPVNMSAPMAPEEMAKYWSNFINSHIPNFRKSPHEQIDNYVKECWEAIVDTSVWAQKELPGVLEKIKPDIICIDNVVLFPATKQYGVPWVRIISCSENEIPDPAIPPHLSGCGENDREGFEQFEKRFLEVIRPIHNKFNDFLQECGEQPYPLGQFFETSPWLNLLLYPEAVRFRRSQPLHPERFQYLEGCVRTDESWDVPRFKKHNDKPLLYISFGSLAAGDTELLARIIRVVGELPYRALVNVGDYADAYENVPANVKIAAWYPQPSVIPKVDLVIHHGGNNTFTECLYFGKPAIIMPYVWDGHDNATRIHETGHGLKMDRYRWSDAEFADNIDRLIKDPQVNSKLAKTSSAMQRGRGPQKAAQALDKLLG